MSTDTRDLVAATIAAHVDSLLLRDDDDQDMAGCSCGQYAMPIPFPRPAAWLDEFSAGFAAHRADAVLTALTEAGALGVSVKRISEITTGKGWGHI